MTSKRITVMVAKATEKKEVKPKGRANLMNGFVSRKDLNTQTGSSSNLLKPTKEVL